MRTFLIISWLFGSSLSYPQGHQPLATQDHSPNVFPPQSHSSEFVPSSDLAHPPAPIIESTEEKDPRGEPADAKPDTTFSPLFHLLKQGGLVDEEAFVGSMNDFTESLYNEIPKDGNLVFSPFSLHMALSMLAVGSTPNSNTSEELLDLLGGFRDINQLQSQYANLTGEYQELNDTFLFGNKLWLDSTFAQTLKTEYQNTIQDHFQGGLEVLPQTESESLERINNWVSDVTKGKISQLFDSLANDVQAVLTNAIYFKDAWTIPFEALEEEIPFKLAEGGQLGRDQGLKMMTRTTYEFGHAKFSVAGANSDLEFEAVTIPYKSQHGGRFEMVIALPTGSARDILKLDDLIAMKLEQEKNDIFLKPLTEALDQPGVFSDEITLVMPEFKVASKFQVGDALRQLNVNGIFTDGDFDGISSQPLKVGQVVHKAIIEVDKEGTVGSAATGIELVPLSGAFLEPTQVVVDKPFLFLIRDTQRNVILFFGKVMNPTLF
eukprot:maker-scaffold281_size224178-snap-gene-0.12 protein:Tk10982 transcript:maker-scaffold281_size224178-snap-gene-0.12-mRNA-1 annotation:"serine protease inhibitor serpin-like protein"